MAITTTATHTYATAGTKTITLTVKDNLGATATTTRTVTVSAPNTIPTASFTVTVSGLTVNVNASASSDPDGTIAAYSWNWGDNTTATGVTASKTYAAAGNYTITLAVRDNAGATASTTRTVTVATSTGTDPIAAREALRDDGMEVNSSGVSVGTDPLDSSRPKRYAITASNTGLLPTWTESMLTVDTRTSFTANNTTQVVIRDRLFTGNVTITGKNYKFKNCKFKGPGSGLVVCTNPNVSGIVFEDCEWEKNSTLSGSYGIFGHSFTLRRCNIHSVEDGIRPYRDKTSSTQTAEAQLANLNVWVYGTYVHDLLFYSDDSQYGGSQSDNMSHCDVVQIHGGSGINFIHCRLVGTINPNRGDASKPNVGATSGPSHVSGNPWLSASDPTLRYPATSVIMMSPKVASIGQMLFRDCEMAGGVAMWNFNAGHSEASGLVIEYCRWAWPRPIQSSGGGPFMFAGPWSTLKSTASLTGNRWAYAGDGHTLGQLYNG